MLVTPSLKLYQRFENTPQDTDFLSFDGTDDYVSAPDSDDWAFGTGDLTFSLGINFSTVQSCGLIQQQEGGNDFQRWFYYQPHGKCYYRVNTTAGMLLYFSYAFIPSANTWYHLAIVRNGNTWYAYVDGVSVELTLEGGSYSATVPNYAGLLSFGQNTGLGEYHKGLMKYIRIYKGTALSQAQIQATMKAERLASTTNLVGYWKLEEGTGHPQDYSGQGNHGTNVGATWVKRTFDASNNWNHGTIVGATLATGKFGRCYSFDGSDDYITVAKHASLALGTSDFTFACWYNFNDKNVLSQFWGNDYVIFQNVIQFRHHGGNTLAFFARTYSGTTPIEQGYCTASFTPDTGVWYHLAFVRNGAGFTIYINGVALDTTVVNALGTVPEPVNIYWIGRYADGGGTQYMGGLLDEMILIKKALSASDIKRVMLGLHPLNG